MNNTKETIKLMACIDCLLVIANDDTNEMGNDTVGAIRGGIKDWWAEGYILVPGDDSDTFSRARCEVCSSTLAGARHEIIALAR